MGKGQDHGGSWMVVVRAVMALATGSMVLFAVAMATNHWLDTAVYFQAVPTANTHDPLFYSRYQGLFTTCYTGGNVIILAANTEQRNAKRNTLSSSGDACVIDDGITVFKTSGTKYTSEYVKRAHLLRGVVGCVGVAIILLIFGMLTNLCGLCKNSAKSAIGAGFLYLFACLLGVAASLIFTLGVVKMQKDDLKTQIEFIAGWLADTTYAAPAIAGNYNVSYGWSFIIANIAAGFALLAALISYIAVCVGSKGHDESEKENLAQLNEAYRAPEVVGQRPAMTNGNDVIRAPAANEAVQPQAVQAQPTQPQQQFVQAQPIQQPQQQPVQQVVQQVPVQQPIMVPVQQAAVQQAAPQQPVLQQPVNMNQDPNTYYNTQEAANKARSSGYPYYNVGHFNPSNPMMQGNGGPTPFQQGIGNGGYGDHKAKVYSKGGAYFGRELADSQSNMIIADIM